MDLSKKQFKELCELQIQMHTAYCYLCGRPIYKIKDYNIDHIQPRSRQGADSVDNWACVHKTCNSDKGALTAEEYRLYLQLKAKRNGHTK